MEAQVHNNVTVSHSAATWHISHSHTSLLDEGILTLKWYNSPTSCVTRTLVFISLIIIRETKIKLQPLPSLPSLPWLASSSRQSEVFSELKINCDETLIICGQLECDTTLLYWWYFYGTNKGCRSDHPVSLLIMIIIPPGPAASSQYCLTLQSGVSCQSAQKY